MRDVRLTAAAEPACGGTGGGDGPVTPCLATHLAIWPVPCASGGCRIIRATRGSMRHNPYTCNRIMVGGVWRTVARGRVPLRPRMAQLLRAAAALGLSQPPSWTRPCLAAARHGLTGPVIGKVALCPRAPPYPGSFPICVAASLGSTVDRPMARDACATRATARGCATSRAPWQVSGQPRARLRHHAVDGCRVTAVSAHPTEEMWPCGRAPLPRWACRPRGDGAICRSVLPRVIPIRVVKGQRPAAGRPATRAPYEGKLSRTRQRETTGCMA